MCIHKSGEEKLPMEKGPNLYFPENFKRENVSYLRT